MYKYQYFAQGRFEFGKGSNQEKANCEESIKTGQSRNNFMRKKMLSQHKNAIFLKNLTKNFRYYNTQNGFSRFKNKNILE